MGPKVRRGLAGVQCDGMVLLTKDQGLIDVRGMPQFWATTSELRRQKELSAANPQLSRIDVSERTPKFDSVVKSAMK